jgi:hypothetical protein
MTLDRVAIDFPELTLIGIHLGYPWTEEMISVCTKHPKSTWQATLCPQALGRQRGCTTPTPSGKTNSCSQRLVGDRSGARRGRDR